MPKIPGISPARAVQAFEKLGYRVVRQGKHIVMSNGLTRLTIPRQNPIIYGDISPACHSEPFDFAQGRLSEESDSAAQSVVEGQILRLRSE